MTAFVDIEAAVVTALANAPAVASIIQRGRSRPLPQEASTGVMVALVGSEIEPQAVLGAPVDITSRVVVELQARAVSSTAPTAAVDTLLAAANGRIAADATLGGTAMDCRLAAIEYQPEDADQAVVAAITTWEVRHRAARTTLATA